MASNFNEKLARFMQGRYGGDELGRTLTTAFVIMIIAAVVCSLLYRFTGGVGFYYLYSVLNFVGLLLAIYTVFRMLSRNIDARRAENQKYLARRGGSAKRKNERAREKARKEQEKEYKYLKCPFCQQEMRVPRGKGKIAVKCPKCGEKTITNS